MVSLEYELSVHNFYDTGASDFKKGLNVECWSHCYTNHACKAPTFFPEEFAVAAIAILFQDLHLQENDININNAKTVYLHLVNKFSS